MCIIKRPPPPPSSLLLINCAPVNMAEEQEARAGPGDDCLLPRLRLRLGVGSLKDSRSSSSLLLELLRSRERMTRRSGSVEDEEAGGGEQLIQLLLVAASAVGTGTDGEAAAIRALIQLSRCASFHGGPIQRVMAYFADGLAARILTKRSPLHGSLVAEPSPEEEFAAFTAFYRASPFFQLAHFTANQTIVEAFEAEEGSNGRRLHVIDFDVSYGFQWPSLIQSLSDKASAAGPISLRLTGFGRSIEELRETESRLVNFSKGCSNMAFQFDGVLRGSPASDLEIDENATLVVNLAFYLQTLEGLSETLATLMAIHSLSPSAVVLSEKEGGVKGDQEPPASFLGRFVESLNYFAATYSSLHECLPAESAERLSIEKNHLGREIKRSITAAERESTEAACGWRRGRSGMMESAGLEEMMLSSRSVSQAKLLLRMKDNFCGREHVGNGGFGIMEEGEEGRRRRISLCWQEQKLVTVSAWRCRHRRRR